MFVLNKIVWFFLNPLTPFLIAAIVGALYGRRRWGRILAVASLCVLWFEATPISVIMLGLPLEREYLKTQDASSLPKADAIVILGGGMNFADGLVYPDMSDGSDRVWHAARLFKAGKAPLILVSGIDSEKSTIPLLLDFGVPRDAIVIDGESRNTYENSRFTEKLLAERGIPKAKILLVTSAWHMPRACGNFSKTTLEVTPAATDFASHCCYLYEHHFWDWISPSAGNLFATNYLFKEWLGKFARR